MRACGAGRRPAGERGFTLIELLVVILIVGVLAAIAVPSYLRQRHKAWRSSAVAAMKNAALAVETYATGEGRYDGVDGADENSPVLRAEGFNPSEWVTFRVYATVTDYCIEGANVNLADKVLVYRSGQGVVDIVEGGGSPCTDA